MMKDEYAVGNVVQVTAEGSKFYKRFGTVEKVYDGRHGVMLIGVRLIASGYLGKYAPSSLKNMAKGIKGNPVAPAPPAPENPKQVHDVFFMVIQDPNNFQMRKNHDGLYATPAPPRVIHNTAEEAEEVAENMAKKYRRKFLVLQTYASYNVAQP